MLTHINIVYMLGKLVYIGLLAGAVILSQALCKYMDRREKSRGFSKECLMDLENYYYEKN